jgi:hypothetical protein
MGEQRSVGISSKDGERNLIIGNDVIGFDTAVELVREKDSVAANNRAWRRIDAGSRPWWLAALAITVVGTLISEPLLHWLPFL